MPAELRALSGPVIGYVGNLSDRIDLDLLDDLVRARPDWQFVFVGSAHLDRTILRLDRHDNVALPRRPALRGGAAGSSSTSTSP